MYDLRFKRVCIQKDCNNFDLCHLMIEDFSNVLQTKTFVKTFSRRAWNIHVNILMTKVLWAHSINCSQRETSVILVDFPVTFYFSFSPWVYIWCYGTVIVLFTSFIGQVPPSNNKIAVLPLASLIYHVKQHVSLVYHWDNERSCLPRQTTS